jgi:hypothetical protein
MKVTLRRSRMALDIMGEFARVSTMYKTGASASTFNALIIGKFGTGKTTIVGTAPGPILIHSFDPGGVKSLTAEINSGKVIPQEFVDSDMKLPTAFAAWTKTFDQYRREGVFKQVGTYVIDSATTFVEAMTNQYLKLKDRAGEAPQLQDYNMIRNMMRDAIKACLALPCNFILTGHIDVERDEVTGKSETCICLTPSLRRYLPLLFDEMYVLECKQGAGNVVDYGLITANTGYYTARTRLGAGGKFLLRETPNIKGLLKKAGFPFEDKEVRNE